jgi:hypothetical protein
MYNEGIINIIIACSICRSNVRYLIFSWAVIPLPACLHSGISSFPGPLFLFLPAYIPVSNLFLSRYSYSCRLTFRYLIFSWAVPPLPAGLHSGYSYAIWLRFVPVGLAEPTGPTAVNSHCDIGWIMHRKHKVPSKTVLQIVKYIDLNRRSIVIYRR